MSNIPGTNIPDIPVNDWAEHLAADITAFLDAVKGENVRKKFVDMAQVIANVILKQAVYTDPNLSDSNANAAAQAGAVGAALSGMDTEIEMIKVLASPFAKDLTGLQPQQMALFKPSENLFSDIFCNFQPGGYYQSINDKLVVRNDLPSWKGWLIRVKPNTRYTCGPLDFKLVTFDDNFEKDIEVDPVSDVDSNSFTTGSKSYWLSVTQHTVRDTSNWMLVEGNAYPVNYISGYPKWIAPPELADGYRVRPSFSYSATPIKVVYENGSATISIPAGERIITEQGPISTPPNDPTEGHTTDPTVLTATNASFIGYRTDTEKWILGAGLHASFDYYIIGWVLPSSKKCFILGNYTEDTPKTVAFFGDSITAGVATSKTFHEFLHDIYGFTCLNYGYGGAGYVHSYSGTNGMHGTGNQGRGVNTSADNRIDPNSVFYMVQNFILHTEVGGDDPVTYPASLDDVDAIVIFAGTNDWSNGVSLQSFEIGVQSTFDYYHNNFGDIPLLVVTPIHRVNHAPLPATPDPSTDYPDTLPEGRELWKYVDIIIQKCKDNGIPYVDAFTMSGLQPNNPANDSEFFLPPVTDPIRNGIHPNSKGHQRIARVIGETLNQLVKWNTNEAR